MAWAGKYTGHKRNPTIVLKAVASHDLWFWHCFFGLSGSLSDINILQRSHLFAPLAVEEALGCDYNVNGHDYTMRYLTDGIYPSSSTFVKTISEPKSNKHIFFAQAQEAC
jgi:hypothetical protein